MKRPDATLSGRVPPGGRRQGRRPLAPERGAYGPGVACQASGKFQPPSQRPADVPLKLSRYRWSAVLLKTAPSFSQDHLPRSDFALFFAKLALCVHRQSALPPRDRSWSRGTSPLSQGERVKERKWRRANWNRVNPVVIPRLSVGSIRAAISSPEAGQRAPGCAASFLIFTGRQLKRRR